jgi:asparagine synthase (glutamine-hydrolysing)
VVDLANALPDGFKLRGLDEKHVLKRAATGRVPDEILRRPKQPYRAPDAVCFTGPGAPDWVGEVMRPSVIASDGIFDPHAVEQLWRKCQATPGGGQLSNADNMALVGVLSTGLLVDEMVRRPPEGPRRLEFRTLVDHCAAPASDSSHPAPPPPSRGGSLSRRL